MSYIRGRLVMPKANWRDDLDFELGINFAT